MVLIDNKYASIYSEEVAHEYDSIGTIPSLALYVLVSTVPSLQSPVG